MVITFDSKFNPPGIYEQKYSTPSFIEHEIDILYSRELKYLTTEIKEYKEGWDSYDGKTPIKESIEYSIQFICYLTKKLKESNTLSPHFPEFCLAPDGVLGFEWDYAKDANLFARIHSSDKIECILTENNNKQISKEIKSEEFIELCKEKLQYNQAA